MMNFNTILITILFFLLFLYKEEKLIERDVSSWQLQGEPTILVTLAHIFNYFAPLMVRIECFDNTDDLEYDSGLCMCTEHIMCVQCKVYLVEDVLMSFLLGILEGGGSVDEHPLIQQLLDLFWLLMEVRRVLRTRVVYQLYRLIPGHDGSNGRGVKLCVVLFCRTLR